MVIQSENKLKRYKCRLKNVNMSKDKYIYIYNIYHNSQINYLLVWNLKIFILIFPISIKTHYKFAKSKEQGRNKMPTS